MSRGNALNTQLATAIRRGVDAGVLYLPKGLAGKVKIAKEKENQELSRPAGAATSAFLSLFNLSAY